MKHIVKRHGRLERFDERKIYATCYAAAMGAQISHGEAEKMCEQVCVYIKKWIHRKPVVTSLQLFHEIHAILKKHHKETAFMYETHRDLS